MRFLLKALVFTVSALTAILLGGAFTLFLLKHIVLFFSLLK